jgi:catechol 2,3-dioxygenase-like lactoylglutathione lyase family enzyme
MIKGLPSEVEVITLFVDDIASSKAFYGKVFTAEAVWEDAVSSVLKFGGLLINLLDISQAPPLVAPLPVGPSSAGARALLTIRVADVDAVCAALRANGVDLLNGPIDRPWGRRTAAFADPSGHVWEVAELIGRGSL